MPRISKQPEERRNELIDAAEELFETIGYYRTAVSDIVKKVSVAQGTFYYYFKSKEDIFLAIIERHLKETINEFNNITNNTNMNALEKLEKIVEVDFILNRTNDTFFKYLHDKENAGIHQNVIVNIINNYKPILTNIIEQGINEGLFKTEYPNEVAEFFLVNTNFLFDPGIFSWNKEEYIQKIKALSRIMEKILELPKGSFKLIGLMSIA